jgi:hypothetical protein
VRPSRRRVAAWIAILAITFNALWPLVPEAEPAGADLPHDICTAKGVALAAGSGEKPGTPLFAHGLAHCAMCCAAPSDAVPSSGGAYFVPPGAGVARVSLPDDARLPAPSPTLQTRPRPPPVLA